MDNSVFYLVIKGLDAVLHCIFFFNLNEDNTNIKLAYSLGTVSMIFLGEGVSIQLNKNTHSQSILWTIQTTILAFLFSSHQLNSYRVDLVLKL